jgi:hypothetical protein
MLKGSPVSPIQTNPTNRVSQPRLSERGMRVVISLLQRELEVLEHDANVIAVGVGRGGPP